MSQQKTVTIAKTSSIKKIAGMTAIMIGASAAISLILTWMTFSK